MAYKSVSVLAETETGRNQMFRDNRTGEVMPLPLFVARIDAGLYDGYHIRVIDGVRTPVSNPDDSENNNLG